MTKPTETPGGRLRWVQCGAGIFILAIAYACLSQPVTATSERVGLVMVGLAVALAVAFTALSIQPFTESGMGRAWLALMPAVILALVLLTSLPAMVIVIAGDVAYIRGIRGYLKDSPKAVA